MIIAFDLATSTGFAIGEGATSPRVGAIRGPSTGDDVGAFLQYFRDFFGSMIIPEAKAAQAEGRTVYVVFEAPVNPPAKYNPVTRRVEQGTSIMTTRKLQGLAGVLELVCVDLKRAGFPVVVKEAHLQTIKKELTGSGRAEKGDMVLAARNAGIDISPGDEGQDEADAFGCWLLGIRYFAPQHQSRWDRILYSGRNRLV